ncbi:hypothetical protein GUITHDRAFT_112115 [Guillardia theta CCMP2712]|uniref:Uncharacterized protein n=1 Tax=Guillardia theta (strain CCMP2712) TaxID=905079 RepID=L1J0N2_GUITC|nr:hypothetical protein GUITHDRAFT_112115 [Guillardia theta CCMP2712]EKX41699.1 hypothetical protein GUITHDRAFT_112115 [Guillardia theta CCMP2712]|eukprot:XP_005828679.1 hypothetical protein GUITHDRAFT_112115 [Guillardia theta CCMP2712]
MRAQRHSEPEKSAKDISLPTSTTDFLLFCTAMFEALYGKKAAALYTQAGDYQKTARFYYKKAEDTYYQANNWAAYDDWRRARDQWDYFYSRNR